MGYNQRHLVVFEESECTRNRPLTVTFKFEPHISDGATKTILVRLSDEDDLHFLYTCNISANDFNNIKSQQGLLVDFDGFSQRVIDLLEQCRLDESNNNPRYVLKFSRSFENGKKIGALRIIEATNFKYLTHLSLSLSAAEDDLLKCYLVDQLKTLKLQSNLRCTDLEETLQRTLSQLAKAEQLLTQTKNEFQDYKQESDSKRKLLEESHKIEIKKLEKELSSTIASLESSAKTEKDIAVRNLERVRSEFQDKLSVSEQEISRLTAEQSQLTASLKNVQEKLQTSSEKNASLMEEISVLRSKLDLSEVANNNQASTVTRFEARIHALESELSSKNQLLSKTQDLLSSEQEQKTGLQEQLQRQTRHLEKVEKSLEKESEEVNKANDIIRRLQNEVKSHHTKSKLRGQVAAEQERLLSSKETELQELRSELERVKGDLKTARDSASSLSAQLRTTSDELTEAQRTIKTNENIIGWLNRQISENQMGQMQQRLKTSGFPTPIPPALSAGAVRLLSPAFGTGTTVGWQTTGVRLTNSLAGLNQNNAAEYSKTTTATTTTTTLNAITGVTPVPSTARPGLSSRPASSVPGYLGLGNSTGLPSFPVGALHKVPESDLELGGYGLTTKPSESSNPLCTKWSETHSSNLPAPVTKSTPLHGDHELLGKTQPTDGPSRPARTTTGANMLSTDVGGRLPTYLPSVLTMRSQSNQNPAPGSRTAQEIVRPTTTNATSACSGPDESERTLHQQSLSSAYFPKPVGAQAQR